LNLNGCEKITDAGVAHLAGLERLRKLDVCGSKITGAGLRIVATLPQLQTLDLGCCNEIADADLLHLSSLKHLRWLTLACNNQITGAGLRHLAGVKTLQKLSLYNHGFLKDDDLQGLYALRDRLQYLDLSGCDSITDAGLRHIAGLQQLRTLSLGGCNRITDAGLLQIAGLKHLTDLHAEMYTMGDDFTGAGVDAFWAAQKANAAGVAGAAVAQ
jgi:Leucine-rich repeat (LRR) protein